MKVATAVPAALLLAGCHAAAPSASGHGSVGDRLEAAARAQGLVPDAAAADPVGLYAAGGDHVCLVAAGGGYRIGATVFYDQAQGCTARGAAARTGDRLRVTFGDCRFDARFEGDRIVFPADLPAACDAACTGRASLSALSADRMSAAAAEAAAARDGTGEPLCAAS